MAFRYAPLNANEIKPKGWLYRQLKIQADGLAGQLDRMWPDVRDSKWFGGDREGWERAPYWLDGFIPLAWLLDDEEMKTRATTCVRRILECQQENGWFYPPNTETAIDRYDPWAQILLGKVLVSYYLVSGDEDIPRALYRFLESFYALLSKGTIRLFAWGEHRWFEFFITLLWARETFPKDDWILDLARLIREQGTDYASLKELWKKPMNKWTQDTHIVNLAMMLKYEAVSCDLLGEEYRDIAEELYRVLYDYNGTPVEIFNGDECLAGVSPIQGAELCSVVELMYSYELLYARTGDRKWAERLETVAFNALPATISDDMWRHQYNQQSNQISAVPFAGNPIYRTNGKDAGIFGLEPHYGCCTANFGQGWPKFARSAFMRAEDGLLSAIPLPSEARIVYGGIPVTVTLETEYPFRNTFVYRVRAEKRTEMKLRVRIPSFAKGLQVNGKAKRRCDELVFGGFSRREKEIRISYTVQPELALRPGRLYYARAGSLVFSLPITYTSTMKEYIRAGVERRIPYADEHMKPTSDWNYGFASRNLVLEEREGDEYLPFSAEKPRLVVKAELSHIDWGYEEYYDTICAKYPHSRVPLDAPRVVELCPYGAAKLRMTELPIVTAKK